MLHLENGSARVLDTQQNADDYFSLRERIRPHIWRYGFLTKIHVGTRCHVEFYRK